MTEKLTIQLQSYTLFSTGTSDLTSNNPSYKLWFLIPTITKEIKPEFCDFYTSYKLQANTELSYSYSDFFKCILVSFLGFGISISKQTGY